MVNCYICNVQTNLNVTRRIFRHEYALDININRMNAARCHRERHRIPPEEMNARSPICINCDERLVKVLQFETDPRAIEFEVVCKRGGNSCVFCEEVTAHRMPFNARVYFYMKTNMYICPGTRCCPNHLIDNVVDEVGIFLSIFLHINM